MIFRTVKDRNYMIVLNDTYMKDKRLSFRTIGLITQTNSVMGSVHYLPPEQANDEGAAYTYIL